MKVLHVSYSDSQGGAAIGARRIHEALLEQGMDSHMLCVKVSGASSRVLRAFDPFHAKFNGLLNRILWHLLHRFRRCENKNLHSINMMPSGLHRMINRSDADIVNLHWINNEMISIREIAKIKKPVVWTLHDMWPINGASHNALNEYYVRFESGYKTPRPVADSWPDVDLWVWKRKRKHWKNFNPYFVAVSEWMANNVRKSALFSKAKVDVIPNTIDVDVFTPADKQNARKAFKLPSGKKIILFACSNAPYKGMELMAVALRRYSKSASSGSLLAVAFGNSENIEDLFAGLPMRFTGRINEAGRLAELYAAADVTCVPSQVESFGQTAAESMACGTPVVAFDCTGLKDIVEHKNTGYLAEPFDCDDFADGIQWVLGLDSSGYDELCANGRAKAEAEWAESVVAAQYISVYETLTNLPKRSSSSSRNLMRTS